MQLSRNIALILSIFIVLLSISKVEACEGMATTQMGQHMHMACCQDHSSKQLDAHKEVKKNKATHTSQAKAEANEDPGCASCNGDASGHRKPCEGKCHHGCGSSIQQCVSLYLVEVMARPVYLEASIDLHAVEKVLRLPSGFDFIWRPPKIYIS